MYNMPDETVPILFSHTGAGSLWYIIIFEATYVSGFYAFLFYHLQKATLNGKVNIFCCGHLLLIIALYFMHLYI